MEDNEELLRLLSIVDQIKGLDLEAELDKKRTPVEKLVKTLGDEKLAELKRNRPKKAVHWRTKKKREKEKWHNYRKPREQLRKVGMLKGGCDGWWKYICESWQKQRTAVELTKEEFTSVLWPLVEGRLPIFMRYDTSKPITLTNIWVVDAQNSKSVLFDGMEYSLREQGYML